MSATFYVGDAISVMNRLPEKSVDLILTSPPFLALRSYLPSDHPDKALEGGSQSTPGEFIDWLLDVVDACSRVLAPHGSLVFELGDTYSGSGQGRNWGLSEAWADKYGSKWASDDDLPKPKVNWNDDAWPQAKSLSLIPESFRWAMVYGHNPFTGRTCDTWRLRNVIRWVRPNPPVGALGDKFRPATSELMVFCKAKDRFFDLDAVRGEFPEAPHGGWPISEKYIEVGLDSGSRQTRIHPAGAPPLDWWNIPLLDGDEETRYGPKDQATRNAEHVARYAKPGGAYASAKKEGGIAERGDKGASLFPTHPAGAPPLDWWEIPPGGYPGAHYACVDDATEALTPNGWRPHYMLMDGDTIAAYNRSTGTIGWETAKFHRYQFDGDLVAIEKRETSQRLTPNHRVLYKTRAGTEHVATAADLKPSHRLPVAAPFNIPAIPAPSVDMAALIGWFVTEGGKGVNTVRIWQSETANPEHCREIRRILKAVGADFTETSRLRANTFSPRIWTEMKWTIRGDIARQLSVYGKCLRADSAFWPEPQALALFNAMVDGDGHRRPDGRISFVSSDLMMIDRLQALVARLGRRSTIHVRPEGYEITIGQRTWLSLRGTNGVHNSLQTEHYKGIVWCPSVPSSFWLARRNGRPFITGNTWPPELLIKPVKAMCPEKVCRVCGEPSRRIVATQPELTGQRFLADEIASRRTQAGVSRAEMVAWFPHYKNGESVMAQVSNWELAKNVPSPGDWEILKDRLGVSGTFDELVNSDRRWTESEVTYEHVSDYPSGNTQDVTGRVYQRLASRKDRIPPERFSDCGHDDWRPGLVLDPFGGSGTTALVATGHGRDAILIDLDERNFDLALDRVGPFILTREEVPTEPPPPS